MKRIHREENPTVPCSWPRAMRPPMAALYIGTTPFGIEELMRNGTLPFKVVGQSRVIMREELDRYIETVPPQTGKLSGRGRWLKLEAA